jgi:hypothetical protein
VVTLVLCSDGYLMLAFNDVQNRPKVGFAPEADFPTKFIFD